VFANALWLQEDRPQKGRHSAKSVPWQWTLACAIVLLAGSTFVATSILTMRGSTPSSSSYPKQLPLAREVDPSAFGERVADVCGSPPRNGTVLLQTITLSGDEGHRFEVQNGSDGNAIVKVKDAFSNRTAISFFVARGASAALEHLPDGRYRIQFGFGDDLDHTCANFADTRGSQEMPRIEDLVTTRNEESVTFASLTYTLFPVPRGNIRPRSIARAAFDAD
jgi:hypothetical protein